MRAPAAACLALLFLAAPAAAEEPSADPDALISRGVELRRDGKDVEALALFVKANDLRPTPQAAAQMGLALQALGRWKDAEAPLERALAAGDDAWVARYKEQLASALSAVQGHLAWLDVTANVEGAELLLDGKPSGTLPMPPVRILEGKVLLELRANGYVRERRERRIAGGSRSTQVFTLNPIAPPSRVLGWVSGAVGVAFLGGAVVANVVREHDTAVYNDDSRCWYGGYSRYERCGSYRDEGMVMQTLAIVGYATAGVALAASAYFFLKPPAAPAPVVGSVRCTASLGVWCSGTF